MKKIIVLVALAFTVVGGAVAVMTLHPRRAVADGCAGTNCTAVIQSGLIVGHNLAIAYNNRGNAYKANGDLDRAIADYNQAIALDPKYALAYNNRGGS